ncbi:MAG: DUF6327 family protein [Aequorivita sp.]
MKPRLYNSFEEIDKQLKILSLKTAIDKENISFNSNKLKVLLYPDNILTEIKNIFRERLIAWVVGRYYHFF